MASKYRQAEALRQILINQKEIMRAICIRLGDFTDPWYDEPKRALQYCMEETQPFTRQDAIKDD